MTEHTDQINDAIGNSVEKRGEEKMATSHSITQALIPENKLDLGRRYLLDDDAPAVVVYETAALLLEGPAYALDAWEPETVWIELKRLGFSVGAANRNKILCCSAIKVNRAEIVHPNVFQNIVLTLNNEIPTVDQEEEVEVEQMAWALVCLRAFLPHRVLELDYGPVAYTADVLHDEGYVLAPQVLSFAQVGLTRKNHNLELEAEVRAALKAGHSESPIAKAQLEKLGQVDRYVSAMYEAYAKGMTDVKRLRGLSAGRA